MISTFVVQSFIFGLTTHRTGIFQGAISFGNKKMLNLWFIIDQMLEFDSINNQFSFMALKILLKCTSVMIFLRQHMEYNGPVLDLLL